MESMIVNATNVSSVLTITRSNLTSIMISHSNQDPNILTIFTKIVCIMILVVGTIGNLLVLVVFGSRWSKLKACEVFMVNLALADLLGSIALPSTTFHEVMGGSFQFIGHAGCKVIHFVIIVNITVSSLTLIAISIDRYFIVKWPLRQRASLKILLLSVVFIWILGSLLGIPYLIDNNVHLYNGTSAMVCRAFLDRKERVIHVSITFSVQVALPIIIMTWLYVLIVYELHKITKSVLFRNQQGELHQRFTRNRKTMVLLCVVVVSFFICITPANIFYMIYLFHPNILPMNVTINVFIILQMLQMANSCINPIIYSKLHTSFRRATLKLFCSCCVDKLNVFTSSLTTSYRYASTRISRSSLSSLRRFSKLSLNVDGSINKESPSTTRPSARDLNRLSSLKPNPSPGSSSRHSNEKISLELVSNRLSEIIGDRRSKEEVNFTPRVTSSGSSNATQPLLKKDPKIC